MTPMDFMETLKLVMHIRQKHIIILVMASPAMYVCKRCNYSTPIKGNYKLHIYRIRPCLNSSTDIIPIDELRKEYEAQNMRKGDQTCDYCGKNFASIASLKKHQKGVCKSTFAIRDFDNDAEISTHLSDEFKIACLKETNMPKLVAALVMNKERQENMCVRLKNRERRIFEVHSNGKWREQDGNETLTDLVMKGYRVLRRFWYNNKQLVNDALHDEGCYCESVSWLDDIEYEEPEAFEKLKRQVFTIFV